MDVSMALFGPDPWLAKDRPVQMYRPCPCGCDKRNGETHVGYLSGSNSEGQGLTIFAPDENTYQHMLAVFGGEE